MDYPALRAKSPSLTGTAVCRAARAVVWHPWLAEKPSVSHGEPIARLFLVLVDVHVPVRDFTFAKLVSTLDHPRQHGYTLNIQFLVVELHSYPRVRERVPDRRSLLLSSGINDSTYFKKNLFITNHKIRDPTVK